MKTEAVMCMAFTKQRPSATLLRRTRSSTVGVMLMNPRRPGTSNQRCSVSDFTLVIYNADDGGQPITGFGPETLGISLGVCWDAGTIMAKKFVGLVVATIIVGLGTLHAQDKGEGTLILDKKTFQLTKAVAFETTIDNEAAIAVVLSGKAVPGEKIKEARDNDKQSADTDFGRPSLKLVFKKTGEFKHWSAAASGTTLGRHSDKLAAELHESGGRVSGKANLPMTEGMFPTQFDARFDVALLKAGDSPPPTVVKKPGPAANVPPAVSGVFKGNGQEAKIAYVSAHWREPFSDKTSIVLVFSEKDHSRLRNRIGMLRSASSGVPWLFPPMKTAKSLAARWRTARTRNRGSARSATSK
jgi:hypothetical protein